MLTKNYKKTFGALLLILAVSSQTMVVGQVFPKTDRENNSLNGKIKSVKATTYWAENKFGQIDMGDIASWRLLVFDAKGFLTENNNSENENYTYTNSYDKQGRIVEVDGYDADKNLAYKEVFTYDNSAGKLTESITYSGDGSLYRKTLYKINNATGYYEQVEYESNGNLVNKYIYDTNGNIIESSDYSNGSLDTKSKYIYNDKGKLTELEIYSSYGDLTNKGIYNDQRDLIVYYSYEKDDDYNTIEKIEYTYEYQYNNNNWIKQSVYVSEAKIASTIKVREIEYYK